MLIKCPECYLNISDKAKVCPHCGFPIAQGTNTSLTLTKTQHRSKHLKLPNGFGQITKISRKNLRKPYRVMVTVGKTDTGKPICKLLKPVSYFETYNQAYEALVEYNRNPYDFDSLITVSELYEKWSEWYFKTLKASSSERTVKSAWSYCDSVKDMQVRDIRARHIKGCIDSAESPNIKSRIKSLFNLMLDYALEYELVDKNYARTFNLSGEIVKGVQEAKKDHVAFKRSELVKLWSNIDLIPYCDLILIQCYSGWRPQELGLIKLEDVDLKNWTFKGGMKTDAGTERIVPIHPLIRDFVSNYYKRSKECGSEYIFCAYENGPNRFLTYDTYRRRFDKVMRALKIEEHRPHDPRKTFVTMAKNCDVNEFAIKRMIGHKIDDLTESTYTERNITWLKDEIEKINRDGKLND